MEYNTARDHLILPEYGRHVQKMVEHATNIKDKEERNVGVLAQQVEKVLPEVVSQDGNGYLNVDYGGIVPLLLEAIKELEARITYLENK